MKKLFLLIFTLIYVQIFAQHFDVYPTNWWTNMQHNKIQLLLHSTEPLSENISINYPGIIVEKIHAFPNKKYLAVDIAIAPGTLPGFAEIKAQINGKYSVVNFPIRERKKGNGISFANGISSKDLIYLIMPDRFSNGDPHNDKFADFKDSVSLRNNPFLRHGGDLQGIINHLDYLNELGVTAIWLTPVIENNTYQTNESGSMRSSYHGYHFTNQYLIDKRFGGNEAYKKMIDSAHAKNIKVIQDAVYNHFSKDHFLYTDPPAPDWFNQWKDYTNTSYKDQPLIDPYASAIDKRIAVSGWFTPFLPDVNQRNEYVAKFLIQHALWTVEEFGIDGWRVDTYFYSDKNFLNKVNAALYSEYPNLSIFGETTMQSVTEQAYYSTNTIDTKWKSNLKGVTDFEWQHGVIMAMNEPFGWSSGIMKLYNVLVQDILYKDPMQNVIFLDNHDQDRIYSVLKEDIQKFKLAIALLLTHRGIPQIYYGTEILMKNFKVPTDAEVRIDFPGGWAEDTINKFKESDRIPDENEAFNYIKSIAQFRKNSAALQSGKLLQYVPVNGVYVYFRIADKETVMVVINTENDERVLPLERFMEGIGENKNFINILTKEHLMFKNELQINGMTAMILKLEH